MYTEERFSFNVLADSVHTKELKSRVCAFLRPEDADASVTPVEDKNEKG